MAEFERPRAKALSDAELARALQTFPSDATGIELAGQLIAEQQKLREQDSQELQAWIELLRTRDDEQSRRILSESIASIFPPEPVEVVGEVQEPPTLTSQLPVITRRGKVSSRVRNGQTLRLLSTTLLLAVSNVLVLDWLQMSGLEALTAIALGLIAATVISVPLKRHLMHPILRAAAVFGGVGVYAFAALILGSTSLAFVVAFEGHSELSELATVGPYSAILIVLLAGAALVGQLTPVRFGPLAIFLATSVGAFFLLSQEVSFSLSSAFSAGWYWGIASAAVVSTLILVIATPHTTLKWATGAWVVPVSVLLSAGLLLFTAFSVAFALTAVTFALMLGLVFSGRDLAGGALGRLAGFAMLLGLILSPWASELSGVAIALIACAFTLMLLDQLFRVSPLHIASLDTSYGFYGAVSPSSWLGLIFAAASGTAWVTASLPDWFNHLEWSLVGGLSIGLVVGLLRIPIIRKQDREIKNLDSSSGNIENLLGL